MNTEWKSKDFNLSNSNLCRLCANVCSSLSPIFGPRDDHDIHTLIKKCLPQLKIQHADSKPQAVCLSCVSKLDACSELIESSVAANSTFDELLDQQLTVQETISDEAEPMLKTEDNCSWLDTMSKHDKETLQVAPEASVIVVSKLSNQSQPESDQDFVVMLEVKYKDKLKTDALTSEPERVTSGDLVKIDTDENKCDQLMDHIYIPSADKYFLIENPFPNGKSLVEAYSQKEKASKKTTCNLCGAKFSRVTRLKAHHLALHTNSRPHACDQCDSTFALRWDLTLHQRLHARTFQCEFCQKTFPARNKLERHRRTHTGERPYQCTHCHKAFGDKRNLDNHVRTHTGERPYQCDICFKSFRVRSHLTDHHRVHSESALYTCKLCDRPFKWKANYSLHMKMHVRNRK